ncbi:MAG: hypothetical protein A2031_07955 [Deltaproteobacteria bacterium RBG_19FT_COMBO_43_11]|nr:MAG: hypothetical protein A2W27_08120 [Deltaproteobacteria bacterium RBG_16_44_11]OGP87129.1 MAG: hypothetical protein A2031_07955 [Deltaproteobacteria bacterium RBG_19FT_COMBO_43_11]
MELSALLTSITEIIQDPAYTETILTDKINSAVSIIAAGIRMPNGQISPPLPDLFKVGTVATITTDSKVPLPTDYQRKVMVIVDSSGNRILPPVGGDYYSFALFLKQISNLNITETGEIYKICVKGSNLYYQGIPAAAQTLGIHYYRKPAAMTDDDDVPDGIPEHLQERLVKHYVVKEIFGEAIEDGQDNSGIGTKYHTGKFYEAMTELCDFIGIDAEPQYYGDDGSEDRGACD